MKNQLQQIGKYQVRSIYGQGAMGVVYQAYDPSIDRDVAIKVLHAQHYQGKGAQEFSQRFVREAQAAARCSHPNIITIYELGQYQGRDYIVMEPVVGEELKEVIDSSHQLSIDEACAICSEVLLALGAAHQQGVVHRDIKPANILLLDNGGVKVADFGAALLDTSDLTQAGDMIGTPCYMSPEALAAEEVDARADIYSTAMVLLEMLTGLRITAKDLFSQSASSFVDIALSSERGQALPSWLEQTIRRATEQNKHQRFDNCEQFLQQLSPETATAITQRPKISHDFSLAPEQLTQLQTKLSDIIGPIAPVLIKKALKKANNQQQFMQQLIKYQDSDKKQLEVSVAVRKIIDPNSEQTQISQITNSPIDKAQTLQLSDNVYQELQQQLSFYIGPLANALIKRCAKQSSSLEELQQKLADCIKDDNERLEFMLKTQTSVAGK